MPDAACPSQLQWTHCRAQLRPLAKVAALLETSVQERVKHCCMWSEGKKTWRQSSEKERRSRDSFAISAEDHARADIHLVTHRGLHVRAVGYFLKKLWPIVCPCQVFPERVQPVGGPTLQQGKRVRRKEQLRKTVTEWLTAPVLYAPELLGVRMVGKKLGVEEWSGAWGKKDHRWQVLFPSFCHCFSHHSNLSELAIN